MSVSIGALSTSTSAAAIGVSTNGGCTGGTSTTGFVGATAAASASFLALRNSAAAFMAWSTFSGDSLIN